MRKTIIAAIIAGAFAGAAMASEIECITAASILSAANCVGAGDPVACCTGAGAGTTCLGLSATSIKAGGNGWLSIEVYSSADAVDGPATCTAANGTVITCAGWDGDGAAEIWVKNSENGPYLQMTNTATMTAATRVAPSYESDSIIALRMTEDGTGGNACLYLSVTGRTELDGDNQIQDGVGSKSWTRPTTTP